MQTGMYHGLCNKHENNQLVGLHQIPTQLERIRREGQNFPEDVAPQEEEEEGMVLISRDLASSGDGHLSPWGPYEPLGEGFIHWEL
jgi:hypothetical protein